MEKNLLVKIFFKIFLIIWCIKVYKPYTFLRNYIFSVFTFIINTECGWKTVTSYHLIKSLVLVSKLCHKHVSWKEQNTGYLNIYYTCICNKIIIGLVRDLNPGPLAPKARIIPLDQRACILTHRGKINQKTLNKLW